MEEQMLLQTLEWRAASVQAGGWRVTPGPSAALSTLSGCSITALEHFKHSSFLLFPHSFPLLVLFK